MAKEVFQGSPDQTSPLNKASRNGGDETKLGLGFEESGSSLSQPFSHSHPIGWFRGENCHIVAPNKIGKASIFHDLSRMLRTSVSLFWDSDDFPQVFVAHFPHRRVFPPKKTSHVTPRQAYVEGVHDASRALVINALLMTLTTYAIPKERGQRMATVGN